VKDFYDRHHRSKPAAGTPRGVADALSELRAPGSRYFCVFDQLPDPGVHSALELGFGYPHISRALASVFGSYIAVDVAARAILARGDGNPGFNCLAADLDQDFPIASGSMDVVIAMMVIEHLFDPFHAFGEVARVCKPGGTVFVNLPMVTAIKNRLALLAGRLPMTSSRNWFELREWDGGHLHYFDVAHVRKVASLNGLEMVATYPVGRFYRLKRAWPQLLCGEISFVFRKDR
jgi:SAM-dependent methyltransferase